MKQTSFGKNKKLLFLLVTTIVACIVLRFAFSLLKRIKIPKNKNTSLELFQTNYLNTSTTQTIDLPLNNPYNCDNFCGPTSRCAISGQQCTADIDCPGCTASLPNRANASPSSIRGNNDAGKLGPSNGLSYSSLTTDIGTQSKLYDADAANLRPMQPNLGENTWITNYTRSMDEFNRRYRPVGLEFIPDYKKDFTLSGEFSTAGPLPSNAYL